MICRKLIARGCPGSRMRGTMKIVEFMQEQAVRHPATEPVDVIKLCFQAAFGAEHLLEDREAAFQYLRQEYDRVQPNEKEPLYEAISDSFCRVNLRAWKQRKLPMSWLFRMFAETVSFSRQASHSRQAGITGKTFFRDCLKEAGNLVSAGAFGFDRKSWEAFLASYPTDCPEAVHHSEAYRQAEKPAYRLVSSGFIRVFPILEAICAQWAQGECREDNPDKCVVAIDGRCASGKTTLAERLAMVTGAGVVHMDDFFLPKELRTIKRLQEPGGNVHYERFQQEVLPALEQGEDFSYRCFNCSRMTYGQKRQVSGRGIVVVEGTYSCHPKLGEYMAVRVFSDVEGNEQQRRIAARDGEEALTAFRERWIPMEENYFTAYRIRERADIVLSTGLFSGERDDR